MRVDKQGRGFVRVGQPMAAVMNGQEDVTEWDDEELLHGKRRDKLGRFQGKPPRLVPAECLRELTRRRLFETESIFREACVEAAKYLDVVVRGAEEPKPGRIKAAETVLDRFLGKPKERVDMHAVVEMSPFVALVNHSIVGHPLGQPGEAKPIAEIAPVIDAESTPVLPEPINVEDRPPVDVPPWRRPPLDPDEDWTFEDEDADEDDFTFEDDDEDVDWE